MNTTTDTSYEQSKPSQEQSELCNECEEQEVDVPDPPETRHVEVDVPVLSKTFERMFIDLKVHVAEVAKKRRESLAFRSAVEAHRVDGELSGNRPKAASSEDEALGLGVWGPHDEFQGDVNYRTLDALLRRVDRAGFERCALSHQSCPLKTMLTVVISRIQRRNSSNFTRRSKRPRRASSTRRTGKPPSRAYSKSTGGRMSRAKF